MLTVVGGVADADTDTSAIRPATRCFSFMGDFTLGIDCFNLSSAKIVKNRYKSNRGSDFITFYQKWTELGEMGFLQTMVNTSPRILRARIDSFVGDETQIRFTPNQCLLLSAF